MARLIAADELPEYTKFLDSLQGVQVMQAPQWAETKSNWQAHRYIEEDASGNIVGVVQVLSINDQKTGVPFFYIPRGPVLADLNNTEAAINLVQAAHADAAAAGASLFRVDVPWLADEAGLALSKAITESLPNGELKTTGRFAGNTRYTCDLDLEGYDYDSWLKAISAKRRNKVHKAEREGVKTFSSSDPALLDRFYELIVENSERQQITYRPKEYFEQMLRAWGEDAFFCGAEYEGKIYSLSINLLYSGRVNELYTGNDLSKPYLQVAVAMTAEAVRETLRRGARYLDFGGVFEKSKEDHLYSFKISAFPKDQDAIEFAGEIDFKLS